MRRSKGKIIRKEETKNQKIIENCHKKGPTTSKEKSEGEDPTGSRSGVSRRRITQKRKTKVVERTASGNGGGMKAQGRRKSGRDKYEEKEENER